MIKHQVLLNIVEQTHAFLTEFLREANSTPYAQWTREQHAAWALRQQIDLAYRLSDRPATGTKP